MAEQVMTEKSAQELTKALHALAVPTRELVRKQQDQQYKTSLQTVGTSETDRFMRKEDPAKNYYKNSLTTLKDILKVNREMLANSVQKFGKGLGWLLGIGGLAGFLLTGKKELLYATIKGFEKALLFPIAKTFDKLVSRVAKGVLEQGGNLLKGFGGLASKLFGTGAKEIAEEGGKALGKFGLKGFIKGGAKIGLKALQKVPILGIILGPVIGIMFAFERWKKGDYVGALLEVGSGLASMIPGLGIPLSLAIDVFLAFRDIKTKPEDIQKRKKPITNLKVTDALLDGLPVIGTIRAFNRMHSKWKKKDYVGAFGEAGMAVGSMIPGFNTTLEIVKEVYKSFSNKKETPEIYTSNQTKDFNSPMASINDFFASDVTNQIPTQKLGYWQGDKSGVNLDDLILQNAKEHPKVPAPIVKSLIMQESGGNVNVKDVFTGSSKYGYARGLGQFIDDTAKTFIPDWSGPEDSRDPPKAVAGIFNYLDYLLGKNKGDMRKALVQYHGGTESSKDILGKSSGDYATEITNRSSTLMMPTNIKNSEAINPQSFSANMNMINQTSGSNQTNSVLNAIIEGNKNLIKTIQEQKITNKQSLSINSAG